MMFLPALYSQLKYCACILPDGAALIRPTKKVPIRRPGKQRATGQITASDVGIPQPAQHLIVGPVSNAPPGKLLHQALANSATVAFAPFASSDRYAFVTCSTNFASCGSSLPKIASIPSNALTRASPSSLCATVA